MGFLGQAALRLKGINQPNSNIARGGKCSLIAAAVAVILTGTLPAQAQMQTGGQSTGAPTRPMSTAMSTTGVTGAATGALSPAYIIGNDRGGYVSDRLRELSQLRASGQRIEIRGRICYSTCTMLLGLPQTCILPNTTFGFHGPSISGKPLAPDRFEHFSKVMAQDYPAPLRSWFMATGRTRITGLYRIKGSEIIRMGVRAC
ncbi:MAG: hypothetical protein COB49_12635 [Alphaproteobacteria bacterium]|nr:MAG: hypothetical protein COB49_12635 [Alphaproteobacteria bacterium]